MKNRKAKKGFTIIELVIVIAVIGILAAVLIPTFSGVIEKANLVAAQETASNAYTQYLSETADTNDVSKYDFVIEVEQASTMYYFQVTAGQLSTTKLDAAPAEGTKIMTVTTAGTLTEKQ